MSRLVGASIGIVALIVLVAGCSDEPKEAGPQPEAEGRETRGEEAAEPAAKPGEPVRTRTSRL